MSPKRPRPPGNSVPPVIAAPPAAARGAKVPAAAPAAGEKQASAVNVACPRCGGALKRLQGRRVLDCRFCGTRSFVTGVHFLPKYRFRHIPREHAVSAVRRLIKDGRLKRDLALRAVPHDVRLVLVPFYEYYARKVGLVERSEPAHGTHAWKTAIEVDTRVMLNDFLRYWPAVKDSELPHDLIDVEKARIAREPAPIAPLDDASLMEANEQVFDPTVPLDYVRAQLGEKRNSPGIEFDFELMDERVNVLFYPVWLVRVSYARSVYTAYLDGVTGRILATRLPANDEVRTAAFLGFAALIGLPLGKLITPSGLKTLAVVGPLLVALNPFLSLVLVALASLVVFGGLAACWNRLRYQTELVMRGDTVWTDLVGKTRKSAMEKASDGILKVLSTVSEEAAKRALERRNW